MIVRFWSGSADMVVLVGGDLKAVLCMTNIDDLSEDNSRLHSQESERTCVIVVEECDAAHHPALVLEVGGL